MEKNDVVGAYIEHVTGEQLARAYEEISELSDQKQAVNLLFGHHLEDNNEAFVVRTHYGTVAMAGLGRRLIDRYSLMLEGLYVHPDYRGRSIGTQLVYKSIERKDEIGLHYLKMVIATDGMWWLMHNALPPAVRNRHCLISDARGCGNERLGGVDPDDYYKFQSAKQDPITLREHAVY